jgi:hypothetical protein
MAWRSRARVDGRWWSTSPTPDQTRGSDLGGAQLWLVQCQCVADVHIVRGVAGRQLPDLPGTLRRAR